MSEKQNTVAEDLSKSITNADDTTSYNYDNDPEKAAIETRVYRSWWTGNCGKWDGQRR